MALTATEEALVRQLLDQQAAILSLAGNESTITSKLGATKVTLSDLVAASTVSDADLLLVRQGTNDKSTTGAVLKTAMSPPDASTTVKGIVELATNAETQTGTDSVRAVTPEGLSARIATSASDPTFADNSIKAASTSWVRAAMGTLASAAGFSAVLAATGYIKFPSWFGGWVVQWGTVTTNGSGLATITFPLTFPTAGFGVALQDFGTAVANIDVYCATLISPSQASVACATNAGVAQAATAYYIAWGH